MLTTMTVCLALMGAAASSNAQESSGQRPPTERTLVVEDAAIYLLPDSSRTPLRTAARGTVLEVLSLEEGWVQVRFLDPQFGLRVGYVESRFVEPTSEQAPRDLSVPNASNLPSATDRLERTSTPDGATRFWYHLGFGYGHATCQGCFGSSNGLSGGLTLGGALSSHFLLGVGTSGFYRSEFGTSLTIGTVDARLRVYPSETIGAFVTGGLGLGGVRVADENEFGTGLTVGAGWDLVAGRRLRVTPFYNRFLMRSSLIDANVDQFGIGITVR